MKKAKRFLILALALLLCLSMAASALADNTQPASATQIVSEGGTVYYDADGKQVTTSGTVFGENGAVVKMTKTVDGTETENEFEITLQVETQQDLRKLQTLSPNAAVMLVMDVSNSMVRCVNCGNNKTSSPNNNNNNGHGTFQIKYYCANGAEATFPSGWNSNTCTKCNKSRSDHKVVETQEGGTCTYKSRLASAQEAAKNFVNQFVNETGAEGTDKRMVAIVSFGSNANRELDWVDVHNDNATQTNMTAVNSAIDGLTANGGTNIEAGLMLAKNNLLDGRKPGKALDGISEIYTILLTDGKPTYYVNGSNISLTGPIIGSTGSGTNSGSTTDKEDVEDVGNEAKAILGLTGCNSRLYSICFGKEKTGSTTTDVFETKPFGDWDDVNPPVKSSDEIGDWLGSFSTKACNGESTANGLFDSFGTIIKLMNIGAKAWLVEDSMGNYISNEGSIPVKNRDNNGSIHNAVDVDTNGTIKWYLLDSHMDDNITTLTTDDDGAVTGVAGFTYKYKIKLDNLATGHTAGIAYNTNGTATLKYMVPDKDGNWPTEEDETTGELKDLKTGTFANPSVKSLPGNLAFTKVNENGDALAGAGFTLALKNETGWTSMTATSDQSGKVSFNNIPSGHSYTLSETTVPDGYQKMDDVDVAVNYGNVSDDGFTNTDGSLMLTNSPKTGTITVTKSFVDSDGNPLTGVALPASVTVKIFNATDTGDNSVPVDTLTLNADGSWQDTSEALPYGTYRFEESDADVNGYTLSSSFNPETVTISDSTPTTGVAVALTNTYTQKVGSLTIKKSNSGATPTEAKMKVTGPNSYSNEVTLNAANGWTVTLDNLPIGTYQVSEVVDSANVTGYSVAVTGEGAVPVTEDANAEITITNTYTQNTGTITVTKEFKGYVGDNPTQIPADQLPESVNVNILDANKRTVDTLTLNAGNQWTDTSNSLPYGTYYFSENADDLADYELTGNEFKKDGYALGKDPSVTIGEGASDHSVNVNVTLTNLYSLKPANLTIKKVIKGIDESYIDSVTFRLLNNLGHTVTGFDSIKVNAKNNWTANLTGLTPGIYTVKEIGINYSDGSYVAKYYDLDAPWMEEGYKVTLKPGETKTITCTNTYSLHEAASIELPISKTVACGEGGVVAPAGKRTFKFKMTIADDTPAIARVKVKPGEYAVSFMGNELTPVNGVYFFDMTVDGIGKQTGTLKINGHADDLNNRKITISELTQTESGYPLDSRWTYDTTVFSVYVSLNDDGEFSLEYSADPQSETWKGESVEFVNLYTDVPVEEGGEPPKTGDNSHFVLWTMLAVLSAAGFVFLMKRRNAHS